MKRTQLLVALLVVVLALAGCGGNDPEPTATPAPAKPAAQAAPSAIVGDAKAGETVYMGTCIACHGPDAKGVVGLGKSLYPADSEFIRTKTDDELVQFILVGRTPDDPLNTTGVGMPAKGGNPAITEQQIHDVIAYIRELK